MSIKLTKRSLHTFGRMYGGTPLQANSRNFSTERNITVKRLKTAKSLIKILVNKTYKAKMEKVTGKEKRILKKRKEKVQIFISNCSMA